MPSSLVDGYIKHYKGRSKNFQKSAQAIVKPAFHHVFFVCFVLAIDAKKS